MPSRSIRLSWSRISFGSRATLPQRERVVRNGLLDLWVCGLLRMSEVVAGLWFFVLIGFVCVLCFGLVLRADRNVGVRGLLLKSQSPSSECRTCPDARSPAGETGRMSTDRSCLR